MLNSYGVVCIKGDHGTRGTIGYVQIGHGVNSFSAESCQINVIRSTGEIMYRVSAVSWSKDKSISTSSCTRKHVKCITPHVV